MNGWRDNGWTGGQYSVWRVLLGLSALVLATRQLAGAGGDISLLALSVTAMVLSVPVIFGWFDGPAAALLATVTVGLIVQDDRLPDSLWPLVAAMLLHAVAPVAPFGSFMAAGRIDPDGGWRLPGWLHLGTWLVLLSATVLIVFDPRPGDSTWISLANRGGVVAATVLACLPRTRRLAWFLTTVSWLGMLLSGTVDWSLAGLVPAWLLASDPGWIPPGRHRGEPGDGTGPTWLFYDGNCGLCHRCVRLALAEDRHAHPIRLAPLGGTGFRETIDAPQRENLPDSIIVVTPDGRVLSRSSAAIECGRLLGGWWRLAAAFARPIPRPLTDLGYRFLASIRYRLFGRRSESCPLLPPELRERFDLRHDE
ncbi:MAG: DCC1-like thiol-disulfide oxidoreductase family protein [Planctomycetota bacterium]|nr:DCC1-like thiol-disulfide oxidoreductase family protein [Planctomycetota bacterium]